jgi:2-aminoadipate transaminase
MSARRWSACARKPMAIDLDHLEHTVVRLRAEGRRVKMLYLVPNFQNPTGLLISLPKRTAVLEWADRHDVLIVEDDPYRDIYFPDVSTEADTRPIVADDRSGRVVYLSSFSKTLAPGFRVGWVSAPPAVAAKIELSKQAEDLCTGGLDQRIVYEACRRGLLESHCRVCARTISRSATRWWRRSPARCPTRSAGSRRAADSFCGSRCRTARPAPEVMPLAQARGVIFVDGHAFFVDGAGQEFMRLSFSAPSPTRIDEGIARLASGRQRSGQLRAIRYLTGGGPQAVNLRFASSVVVTVRPAGDPPSPRQDC